MKFKNIKIQKKIRIIINIIFLLLLLQLKENEIKTKFILSLITPKISVFLPIYNKEEYLIRSISSIQIQTIKNIEIVAVNDGSTDNTLKILKKLSKKDKRIKIINNDRNHGLLYSRAMGIINSNGEYLMNLDPDDKFESKKNLEILYNRVKKSNLDYLLFLIKRIPRNNLEIEECKLRNKLQLQNEDFLITNKIIKKTIFLKAYNYIYKEIHKYKWNFHEDNIWNILTRKFSKKKEILKKYIYIYKKNKQSLNMELGNLIEIKNRIYRLKTLIKINENIEDKDKYINDYIYFQYHKSIIRACNTTIFKDNEIKKKIIEISVKFLNIFNNNKEILKYINNKIINKISDNKIIFFFNSFNKNVLDYLTYLIFHNILKDKNFRKIIFIDINDIIQVEHIRNYIYFNDILFGLNDILFHDNFLVIINSFNKNKIIIFYNNQYINSINNNIKLNNSSNYFLFSYNQNYNDSISANKLYSVPVNVMKYANYFNYIKNSKNNNNISILLNNYYNIKIMEKVVSKYYSSHFVFKIKADFNSTYLKTIIQKSKIIITDNIYIMKLSILYFTSCIVYGNYSENNQKTDSLLFSLDYIKFISDINELEKKLIELKNISNNFDLNYNNLNKIINIFN